MRLIAWLVGGVLGLVVLVAVAAIAVLSSLDWNAYKPEIGEAVRKATGRDLTIGGDIELSLFPQLAFSVGDVSISNAPGMPTPEMLSLKSVSGRIDLFPLLKRDVIVESFVLREPVVNLEVDEQGRPNWRFEGTDEQPKAANGERHEAPGGLPFNRLQLGDVRIDNGQVSYVNASTGQALQARDIALKAALADMASPFSLDLKMTVHDEPVAFTVSLDSPDALLEGGVAKLLTALEAKRITAGFDGKVQQQPVPGLDGVFDLDIPSVGRLADWLGVPLAGGAGDPGPLKAHAVFAAEGEKVALKEANLDGKDLTARAHGSFDGSGDVARISAVVESGVLDIDRYLPPVETREPAEKAAPSERPGKPGDALAALSDEPIDLAPLRKLDADVRIAIGGVRVRGFEIGKIDFTATGKQGVVEATLNELGLYGGNVKGNARLDGSGKALDAKVLLDVDRVDVGKLARAATREEPPVAGIASARIDLATMGASPRKLVQALAGTLGLDLGGIDVKAAPGGALTELKADIKLQGLEGPPSLSAQAVYNKERVKADLTLDPLKTVLNEDRFQATADVQSAMVSARYQGWIQRAPVPGLDGTFDADVPSVGKLAAWLGQPLGAGQPDPGPLKLQAVFKGDGSKIALERATLEGKAVRANASGSFDGGGTVPSFSAKVVVDEADLNAYLPPERPAPAETKAPAKPAEKQAKGWSEEPLDLTALSSANGDADIQFRNIRYRDLFVEEGRATAKLAGGVLEASIERVKLAEGELSAASKVDGSSPAAAIDYRASVVSVQARPLLKAFAGTDRLSGRANFEATGIARGRNQKELVESLNGNGRFKFEDGAIHGINIASALRKAQALGLSAEAGAEKKTDFTELGGSFTITNGILENRDFKMLAPLLRISGGGTVPLPPQTVDYGLEAKLVPSLEGGGSQDDALAGIPIPIRITGPWDNLAYGVDWQSVFRQMATDPERLRNMPEDLQRAAKGFGVDLPISKLPGGDKLPDILKAIPMAPKQEESATPETPAEAPADLKDTLKKFKGLFSK